MKLQRHKSTSQNILLKDILWNFIVKNNMNKCFHCLETMDRYSFSIEHKVPWLHSDNEEELFFDLDNISFSHNSCNSSAARKVYAKCGKISNYNKGCRCELCKNAKSIYSKGIYTTEKRTERYLKTGH